MQRIAFGSSPSKENTLLSQSSPIKKGKSGALLQLISFIKTSGIVLPPSIVRIISNGIGNQSPLKQAVTNRDHVDDSKKLRVQLSDVQFQYKKLEEDFAEFKRNTKAEREKDAKKYEDVINRLKSTLENSTQDSTYTITKLKQVHHEEVTQLKQRSKLQLQQEKTKIHNEYQVKIESQIKLNKRELAQLQRNEDRRYCEKVKSMEEQIQKTKSQHAQELKDISNRHKQIMNDKEKRHDSIRLALESQRKTQEKLHQKTKLDASKEKEKLITELCYQKNVNIQLKEELQAKEKEILRLKSIIRDKDIDIQLLDQKTKKKLAQNQRLYNQKVQKLSNMQAQQIVQLKHSQQSELQQFLLKIAKLETIHKEKEEMMLANIDDLSNNFERRPSKRQDITELQKMKWALAKKQQEIRKLTRDLKHCSLELQNKQQMYTRIFRGNSMSRDKKTKDKQDKEQAVVEEKLLKEPLFRKSQTSDIKFLLKMYNNTKNA